VNKIILDIDTIGSSRTQSNSYTLILTEREGTRALPIIIGGFEAQAIVVALENIKASRPLTHDMFVSFMTQSGVKLNEVLINDYKNEIFYAQLHCEKNGENLIIDARPSDAIALAVRVGCEVFILADVLQRAIDDMTLPLSGTGSISSDHQTSKPEGKPQKTPRPKASAPMDEPEIDLKSKTIAQLDSMLEKAIEKEDYTLAILIRDELNARNTG